jgi:hypothetical protein
MKLLAAIELIMVAVALGIPATGHPAGSGATEPAAEWKTVEETLGSKGQAQPGGVFRVGMPRTDLKVSVQGVEVKPGFALGSYAAFRKMGGQTMVMGDLVLLDEEVSAVMSGLLENGLQVTALHNHLNEMSPHVMYMHFSGRGDPLALARGLRRALGASATPLGTPPAPAASGPAIDQDRIEAILGRTGKLNNGILQVSVPRAERITEDGMELLPAMGVATVLNFQPTGDGKAAITGDFVLLGREVNAVAQTLRGHGIAVTALHQHALADNPRLFYMHFWANDDALKLSQGLKAALDHTRSAKMSAR